MEGKDGSIRGNSQTGDMQDRIYVELEDLWILFSIKLNKLNYFFSFLEPNESFSNINLSFQFLIKFVSIFWGIEFGFGFFVARC